MESTGQPGKGRDNKDSGITNSICIIDRQGWGTRLQDLTMHHHP